MPSFNQVIVMGHLTRDPELSYGKATATAICKFSLATNRKFKDNEEVCFFDITAFGRLGELASEYLSKGRLVHVTGRLKQDTWEVEDGSRRSKMYIIASEIQFLGGKGNGEGSPRAIKSRQDSIPSTASGTDDDDIPF